MAFTTDAPKRVSDVLAYDIPLYSREQETVASGQGKLEIGTIYGRVLDAAPTAVSAPKSGGNTGTGTLTLDATTPVGTGAKPGAYRVRLVTAAANGGTFRVSDPDGFVLGDVAVGATFDNDIKFATADGGTDFVVGDGFDITVTVGAGSRKIKKLNPSATDGTQVAAGVLIGSVDATSADKRVVTVRRHAEVKSLGLVWPVGITSDQKVKATDELERRGIVVRANA